MRDSTAAEDCTLWKARQAPDVLRIDAAYGRSGTAYSTLFEPHKEDVEVMVTANAAPEQVTPSESSAPPAETPQSGSGTQLPITGLTS